MSTVNLQVVREDSLPVVIMREEPDVVRVVTQDTSAVLVREMAGPGGPAGPEGPQGPAGPSGEGVVAGFYAHVQSMPSAVWTITHNLGFRPAGVTVVDSGGTNVEGDIVYTSANTMTISFVAAFGGTAYLS